MLTLAQLLGSETIQLQVTGRVNAPLTFPVTLAVPLVFDQAWFAPSTRGQENVGQPLPRTSRAVPLEVRVSEPPVPVAIVMWLAEVMDRLVVVRPPSRVIVEPPVTVPMATVFPAPETPLGVQLVVMAELPPPAWSHVKSPPRPPDDR